MASVRVLMYAVALIVLQSAHVLADPPRDSVTRKGIIKMLLTLEEANQFRNAITIDVVDYERFGPEKTKYVEEGRYLALIRRYVRSTNPDIAFDLMGLAKNTGVDINIVTGAILLPLKDINDLDDAIIEMDTPPGLEFVLVDKKCSFITKGRTDILKTYYCGDDNYQDYMD